jgi:formylglycine-generating enzyme required for sulfatase activity
MGVRDEDVPKLSDAMDAAVEVLGEDSKDFFEPLLTACRPQRRVRLTQPLYVAEAETTIGQFRRFVEATGHKTASETNGVGGQVFVDGNWTTSTDYDWRNPGTWASTDEHPVTQLGRDDAIAFCDWLAQEDGRPRRLPTEAEWEFAACAGGAGLFSFGDDPLQMPQYGWHTADVALLVAEKGFLGRLYAVKQKRSNAFGLYDMQGNVNEFCSNWFIADYSDLPDPAVDPAGPETGEQAVTRGGSAFAMPAWCAPGVRWSHPPAHPQYATGFRVVGEVQSPSPPAAGPATSP